MNKHDRRVVVTGLGVIAPNGIGLSEFEAALRAGQSGIRAIPQLADLGFRCQVGGIPQGFTERLANYFSDEDLLAMNEAMIFGCMAAIDAWRDGGLEISPRDSTTIHWDSGCVLGSGLSGIDTIASKLVPQVDSKRVRRMGSTMVEQTMGSSISAKLGGLLALGNQVTTNSSACNTGTEAIHDAYYRIRMGLAERMLAGGAESSSPYIWAGFDSMRVLNGGMNAEPERASRPMSRSADGFIPGSGSGVVLLESLDSAKARGARIYAEVLSAAVNCGGHRCGGSMTAPNSGAVTRVIKAAVAAAGIRAQDISAINGHLTGTMGDPLEVRNWAEALDVDTLPPINSTKSMIGHCLGAAGGIETVGAVLQLHRGFIHPSINCEDLHEQIEPYAASIPHKVIERELSIVAKSSFGFGDVNGCLILKRWQ